ncbi:hypothetical protein Trydic_g21783 [Trypoxylus dichotomus]
MDELLKNWKEYQSFRSNDRRLKLGEFPNILVTTGEDQYEATLRITDTLMLLPDDKDTFSGTTIYPARIIEIKEHGAWIRVNMWGDDPPLTLTFPNEQSKAQAFTLLVHIAQGLGNPLTTLSSEPNTN